MGQPGSEHIISKSSGRPLRGAGDGSGNGGANTCGAFNQSTELVDDVSCSQSGGVSSDEEEEG